MPCTQGVVTDVYMAAGGLAVQARPVAAGHVSWHARTWITAARYTVRVTGTSMTLGGGVCVDTRVDEGIICGGPYMWLAQGGLPTV
nr:hypothetical protein Iba_chr11cCG12140 [Ipomoea batatas]